MDPTVFPVPGDEDETSSIYSYNTTNPFDSSDISPSISPISMHSLDTTILMANFSAPHPHSAELSSSNSSSTIVPLVHPSNHSLLESFTTVLGSLTNTTNTTASVNDTLSLHGKTDSVEIVPAEAAIGIFLALLANFLIAGSIILKKQSLSQLHEKGSTRASEGGMGYLRAQRWWVGLLVMGVGEVLNSIAYIFAPAILVTPLGVFSIAFNAALSPFFLKETLGGLGRVGCSLTLVGCLIITLCGPKDQELVSMDELDFHLSSPPFLIYSSVVISLAFILMFLYPKYGKNNIFCVVFIVACFGSMAVLFVKGIGLAVKTTIEGTENGFTRLSFWGCWIVLHFFIAIEIVYSQKALDKYNSTIFMSCMYVTFVSLVIISTSVIFAEASNIGWKNIVLTISGFLINIAALYILNIDLNPTLKITKENSTEELPSIPPLDTTDGDKVGDRQLYEIRRDSITLASHTPMPTPRKGSSINSCNLPNIATAMFRENTESNSCLSLISESPSSKNNYNKDNNSFDSNDTNSRCNNPTERNHPENEQSSRRSSVSSHGEENCTTRKRELGESSKTPSISDVGIYATKPTNSVSTPDARISSQEHKVNMRSAYSEGDNIDRDQGFDTVKDRTTEVEIEC